MNALFGPVPWQRIFNGLHVLENSLLWFFNQNILAIVWPSLYKRIYSDSFVFEATKWSLFCNRFRPFITYIMDVHARFWTFLVLKQSHKRPGTFEPKRIRENVHGISTFTHQKFKNHCNFSYWPKNKNKIGFGFEIADLNNKCFFCISEDMVFGTRINHRNKCFSKPGS